LQNADYLVVLDLLNHPGGRSRGLLSRALDIESGALEKALESLERDGVIIRRGEVICASIATRRLDQLNLIAV
jgi:DNA-binding HxlR family transcriptional regulator